MATWIDTNTNTTPKINIHEHRQREKNEEHFYPVWSRHKDAPLSDNKK